jgi:hypothetical protein
MGVWETYGCRAPARAPICLPLACTTGSRAGSVQIGDPAQPRRAAARRGSSLLADPRRPARWRPSVCTESRLALEGVLRAFHPRVSTPIEMAPVRRFEVAHSEGGQPTERLRSPGGSPAETAGWRVNRGGRQGRSEGPVLAHPIPVAPNVDDVAVAQEPVDELRGHHVVAQRLAPLVEALVAREDGSRVARSGWT